MHSEGKSPFIVDEKEDEDPRSAADNVSNDEEERMFAECPIDGCGEVITLAELEDHIELHAAEEPSSVAGNIDGAHLSRLEENDPPRPRRDHGSDATAEPAYYQRNAESIAKWKRILHMPLSSSTRRQPLEASSGLAGENSKRRLGVCTGHEGVTVPFTLSPQKCGVLTGYAEGRVGEICPRG